MRQVLLPSITLEIEAAQATLPAPSSASDGEAVPDNWRQGASKGHSHVKTMLTIDAAGSCNIAAGAYLAGMDADENWRLVKYLNVLNGVPTQIDLTANVGFAECLENVGVWRRLAVVGTLSTSTVTCKATPIEEIDRYFR
jgi:hypothetical protein